MSDKNVTSGMQELLEKSSPQVISIHPGDIIEGRVIAKDRGKILVDIGGTMTGIISGKELIDTFQTAKKLNIGDQVVAFVLEDENEEGMTILSLRKAAQSRAWDHFERIKQEGGIVEAVAKVANKGGLMTEVNGVTAFLPVSQLAPQNYPRVDGANAEEILSKLEKLIGKKFLCKIILLDQSIGKVVLSEREASSSMRGDEMSKLKVGDVVDGEINGLVKFGAFMIFGNLEGLIHISELTWKHVKNPTELFKIGDKVKAQVIGVEGEKISLSLKRLQPDPWKDLVAKYEIGKKYNGVINKVTNFGVFVTLEEDVNGLVHTSEFVEAGSNPEKLFKEGDEVEVKLLEIMYNDHSFKLSFKGTKADEAKAEKAGKKKKDEAEEIAEEGEEKPKKKAEKNEGGDEEETPKKKTVKKAKKDE